MAAGFAMQDHVKLLWNPFEADAAKALLCI